ncbi:MAG TPA: DUF3313 domain-containing protein [Candidatus Competibacteraceae bacterium]|nr:DUF3313 domain-containing protein [Candidatus Competibacteraceae bacterium]
MKRTVTRKQISVTGVLLSTILLASCASNPEMSEQPPSPTTYAKFLTHPDRLQPVPGDSGAYRWSESNAKLARYNQVLLENIRVHLASDANDQTIDPTELKALTDYFYQSIVKALGDAYPVVTKPGRGVLRARITIVDLVPTQTEMSVVTLVVPYATVADMASGAAAGGPVGSSPYLGRTGIAAQFIDSETGQVVAEYADTDVGRKYVLNTSEGVGGAITTGVSDYMKAYSTWAYAQQAFDGWAQQFRARLDRIHGR